MKNKYFTPDIEDFHVGYEYEYEDIIPSGSSDYFKSIISKPSEIENLFKGFDTGMGIRVPYLTKELIEAEKWEYLSEGYIEHQSFYKDDFEMSCFYDKHLLKIIKKEKVKTVVLYQGRCKCINEFRKIIKLLEI